MNKYKTTEWERSDYDGDWVRVDARDDAADLCYSEMCRQWPEVKDAVRVHLQPVPHVGLDDAALVVFGRGEEFSGFYVDPQGCLRYLGGGQLRQLGIEPSHDGDSFTLGLRCWVTVEE